MGIFKKKESQDLSLTKVAKFRDGKFKGVSEVTPAGKEFFRKKGFKLKKI